MENLRNCELGHCLFTDEASQFGTETYYQQIRSTFHLYKIDLKRWAVYHVADNCKFTRKIAGVLKIAHFGCLSRRLNLEVEEMNKKRC